MRWGALVAEQGGFTLIEILVSALILTLLSLAVLGALDSTTRSSYSDRVHADAEALAQQNENRLRGLNIDQLSNLNSTFNYPTKLDGVQFTLTETANYVTDSTGTVSCTNPSADYLEATTTVKWPNMAGRKPVSVTSVLTPTVGSVDSGNGALAVSVLNAAGAGYAGVNVTIAGASNATSVTASSGCALFGDLPAGAYTVTVAPGAGTYVDSLTGGTISAGVPDTRTVAVLAGSVPTSAPFSLDAAGTVGYTFSDIWPSTGFTAPATPVAPAVVLFNTNMNAPSFRVCGSGASCAVVGGTATPAFTASGAVGPLFPFKSSYSTYAGTCQSNDPSVVAGSGVTDSTVTVPPGGSPTASVPLPTMIVKLYSGTSVAPGSLTSVPVGGHLLIKDSNCGVIYNSTPAAGQITLPLNPSGATANTGLLKYPGLPYGYYKVCYDDGSKHYTYPTNPLTNTGNPTTNVGGETVNLYAGSPPSSGVCT
jgi:prepilin-type N-terminal cleavage/methylation domain-containing protein